MEQKQKIFEENHIHYLENLAFGQEGEHEVAMLLLEKGVAVMPLYQFTPDHAPYILKGNNRIICPDLICFKKIVFMGEVKSKHRWVEFNGIKETGLDSRLYEHYLDIEETTKLTVYVFFNHKIIEPIGIYFTKLRNYTREWDGIVKNKRIQPKMIFYNYETLKFLGLPLKVGK